MGSNLENDRSLNSGKMYPIDLAPQKITIVKNVSNTEMKMAHLLPGQSKPPGTSQIITHSGPLSGPLSLMRPGTQLISSGVASQPQMIVSGSPILQGTQIVSQGTQAQLIGSSSQMISQSQLISPQLMSPGTQIISQGTQLSVSNSIGVSISTAQTQVTSQPQVLSVGSQLVSGSGNIVMGSSVRTLPPSVRVLPPLPHHNTRPMLSSVNVTSAPSSAPVSSHVPRGLAAGASLAVRPVAPQGQASQGWGGSQRGRTALVYGARSSAPAPTPAPALTPAPVPAPLLSLNTHTNALTLTTANVLTSNSVISGAIRNVAPRAATPPAPRPLPLLQRNYQPAKVVGVASVGVRSIVGNSAPTQLYYEVPRAAAPSAVPPRPTTPYHSQVSIVNSTSTQSERPPAAPAQAAPAPPRPTILRKRDQESSPTKGQQYRSGWEDVPVGGASGGSTTISAASSPEPDLSPRKKPRKQLLNSEVRQCDIPVDESPPTPPAPPPPPKRPQLSSSYVCGWRSTALHFIRPSDVKRREPKHRDIFSIANTKHALTSAQGWKVHALTAQMEDLVSLESDVGAQLANVLRALETQSSKSQSYTHNALELIKGNIQRSKIVCEGIQEAREDILRVFTHRGFVSDILTRQADKRCFRKHRSQS